MKKIEFNSNVEFVAKAKELLTDPKGYPYGYNAVAQKCEYRTSEGKRCIAGRMFFGHIPEDTHYFWNGSASISFAPRILREKFPYLNWEIARRLQVVHDKAAHADSCNAEQASIADEYSWENIESLAKESDAKFLLRKEKVEDEC